MASTLDQPGALSAPFAYSGDKNSIPTMATGTQAASLEEGFPAITSTPISEGGIPPQRTDFNGLGYLLSSQYYYLQNGGRFTFNQEVSDAIGGYPQGAILQYTNGATSYQVISLINNNTYNFVNNPSYINDTYWSRVFVVSPDDWVTINTPQTITGPKTFYTRTSGANLLQSTGSTSSGSYVDFIQQINGSRRGTMRTKYNSDGSYSVLFGCNGPQAEAPTGITVNRDTNNVTTVTVPTPTENTTLSYQVATVGWANSTNNNIVHKTGVETINNEKTFTANLIRAHTGTTKGTNPSSPVYWGVEFIDKNGVGTTNRLGLLETKLNTNGDVETYIASYLNTSGSSTQTALKIVYTKSGSKYAIAPASDVIDSILTTVNKSKSSNGYFKLGNGLIIQWGRMNTTSTSECTVTFPIPFSSASSYTIVKNYQSDAGTDAQDREVSFYSMTTTSAKTYSPQGDTNQFSWLAIGY